MPENESRVDHGTLMILLPSTRLHSGMRKMLNALVYEIKQLVRYGTKHSISWARSFPPCEARQSFDLRDHARTKLPHDMYLQAVLLLCLRFHLSYTDCAYSH